MSLPQAPVIAMEQAQPQPAVQVESIEERLAAMEADITEHKVIERVQTIEQFKHMCACEFCNLEVTPAAMCDVAQNEFPIIAEPIELQFIREEDSV